MLATFLFRIRGHSERGYGKYIGKYPVHYEEGLDRALVRLLLPVFQRGYGVVDEDEVALAVLSMDRHPVDYSSEKEKDVLDVLYCEWSNEPAEIYVRGKAETV